VVAALKEADTRTYLRTFGGNRYEAILAETIPGEVTNEVLLPKRETLANVELSAESWT